MRVIYDVKHRYTIRLKFSNQVGAPSQNQYLLYRQRISISILLQVFGICCRCRNLTYFYNKAGITWKHRL